MSLTDALAEHRQAFLEEVERKAAIYDQLEELLGELEDDAPAPVALPPAPRAARPPRAQLPPAAPAKRQPSAGEMLERLTSVAAAVRALQPAARKQLLERTGLSESQLKAALDVLRDRSTITTEGRGAGMRYWITADRDALEREIPHHQDPEIRRAVLAAITADPDKLTDERLALALNQDREDVASSTGVLLEQGRVRLNPDATYGPVG